jgi:hypothetical protein
VASKNDVLISEHELRVKAIHTWYANALEDLQRILHDDLANEHARFATEVNATPPLVEIVLKDGSTMHVIGEG